MSNLSPLYTPRFQECVIQTCLNTCTAAVFTEEVRWRTANWRSRILLGDCLQHKIAERIQYLTNTHPPYWNKLAWPEGPRQGKWILEEWNCTVSLQTRSHKAYQNTLPTLSRDWGAWVQQLLSLVPLLKDETHTPLPITLNTPFLWGRNTRLNALLYGLIRQVSRLKSSLAPSLQLRQEAGFIDYDMCLYALKPYVQLSAPDPATHSITEINTPNEWNESLWQRIYQQGLARAESKSHAYLLYANSTRANPHCFMIYDPLKGNWQLMVADMQKCRWVIFLENKHSIKH